MPQIITGRGEAHAIIRNEEVDLYLAQLLEDIGITPSQPRPPDSVSDIVQKTRNVLRSNSKLAWTFVSAMLVVTWQSWLAHKSASSLQNRNFEKDSALLDQQIRIMEEAGRLLEEQRVLTRQEVSDALELLRSLRAETMHRAEMLDRAIEQFNSVMRAAGDLAAYQSQSRIEIKFQDVNIHLHGPDYSTTLQFRVSPAATPELPTP